MISTPTSANNVGVVYSTIDKQIRQYLFAANDDNWTTIQENLAEGLSLALISMTDYSAGGTTFDLAIAIALVLPNVLSIFTSPICVVVDNTSLLVEEIIMADANIDTISGKTLVNIQGVTIGSSYNPITQLFTPPAIVVPIKV